MSFGSVMNLESEMVPVGSGEELAVQTAVVAPAALDANASHGLVVVKTGTVNVTMDGTDPADGGRGMAWPAGTMKLLAKETIGKLKLIRGAGSNGVVHVQGMAARG